MNTLAAFFASIIALFSGLLGHNLPKTIVNVHDVMQIVATSTTPQADKESLSKSSWIGLDFSTTTPDGITILGSVGAYEEMRPYGNSDIFSVKTEKGEEIWSVGRTRNGDYIERVVLDSVSLPLESDMKLVWYDCRSKDGKTIEASVVALVTKSQYMSPTFSFIEPQKAWKINSFNGKFESIPTDNIVCNSNEPDPY